MANDGSFIIKPKDPASILRLQDPTVIEQLLENPPAVLAELLAGWFASGNGFMAAAGCRIVQAAFKGRIFQQFAKEFSDLKQNGKIAEDFNERPYGYKSWVELLTILDEETPDAERVEALKAMFYSVNKISTTDGERIANYQLFRITKKLTSSQLLLLRILYEEFKSKRHLVQGWRWKDAAAKGLGHSVFDLISMDEQILVSEGLMTHPTPIGSEDSARLTGLGKKLCESIETYHMDLS
jgi:hypothetical protein